MQNKTFEFALVGVLALLWGSSYMWMALALETIPPLSLIALRVFMAAGFLVCILAVRGINLPKDKKTWQQFFIQSIINSSGPWLLLAWGQQYVESAVAGVLNSTSPLFVFFFAIFLLAKSDRPGTVQLLGALAGVLGIVLIVGAGALDSFGEGFLPQLAVLLSAALYGVAALRGRQFSHLPPMVTAAGTLICAAVMLVPISLIVDQPWQLDFSTSSLAAAGILSLFCTAFAFLIYFRLLNTIGAMGTASQAYLRSGVGVVLGVVFLSETLDVETLIGICLAIAGVVLINWPRKPKHVTAVSTERENS